MSIVSGSKAWPHFCKEKSSESLNIGSEIGNVQRKITMFV